MRKDKASEFTGGNLIFMAVCIFLFYWGVVEIYINTRNQSPMMSDASGAAIWLYPTSILDISIIITAVVAGLITYIIGAGFSLIHNFKRHGFNYAYAMKVVLIGAFFAVLGFVFLQYMMAVKMNIIYR